MIFFVILLFDIFKVENAKVFWKKKVLIIHIMLKEW